MNERAPLRPLAPGLWEVERIVLGAGMRARVRMVVVALAGGGLWLHSPVAIDDALADALASLGEVREIVAPNRFHHLFAAAAKARYPAATLWGAPGLARKRPAIAFDRALDRQLVADIGLHDVDPAWRSGQANITGKVGAAHGDADPPAGLHQRTCRIAADETRPAENRDQTLGHET